MKKQGSFLKENTRARITSVFPPTTAAGVTTFFTGVAGQQHAMTAWYMFFKELGMLTKSLPFCPRIGGKSFSEKGYEMKDLIDVPAFTSRVKAKSFIIQPEGVKDSSYSRAMSKKAVSIGYKNLNDYFNQIKKALRAPGKRKYIYAYWPEIDGYSHEYGVGSKQQEKHFKQLDRKLGKFIQKIQGTNTTVIVTADHGLMNAPKEKLIWLKDYPKIAECLDMPLAGEGRMAYCYVKPRKTKQFEYYVKKDLSRYCILFRSDELIGKKIFGLGQPNKKLFDRVGDYVLMMKDYYLIRDWLEEKDEQNIGHHGGLSKEEVFVPLIVLKC